MMDPVLRLYFKWRQKKIEQVANNPVPYQAAILKRILQANQETAYGRKYNFKEIHTYQAYSTQVPSSSYEDMYSWIMRMKEGAQNLLCADPVPWFAKSSGTSSDKSKLLPTTDRYLIKGHLKCTWAAASLIYNQDSNAKLFAHKNLIMGGSISTLSSGARVGDISAILLHNFPKIGRSFYTPDFDTALIPDWEEKIGKMVEICTKEKVCLLGGVPSWLLVFFKAVLDYTGKSNISEVWPELRSLLHGGMSFGPYAQQFKTLFPSENVIFREVYNASEGYFAIQDQKDFDGMLLLCDHEIFYEFIPYGGENAEHPIPLHEVECNKSYIMLITNCAGLYRYRMGDIIEFVSIQPFRIKHRGRVEQCLNVFGEELILANTDKAIAQVCNDHRVNLLEYTVAPIFMQDMASGGHEWIIELEQSPINSEAFVEDLDKLLMATNTDYAAKRSGNKVLAKPSVHLLPKGSIRNWMRAQKRYGGQNKLPRLSNTRKYLEAILKFNSNIIPQ